MKTHTKIMSVTMGLMLGAVALFTHGCATPQVTSTQTPVVSQVPTPVVSTNAAGVEVTNIVVNVTTNFVTTLTTNFVANQTITTLGQQVPGIATIVGTAVPQPYGGMAALIIGLLGILGTGAASAVAAAKNAQVNQHASTIQAMGTGIENALPAIQSAITTAAASSSLPVNAQQALTTANAALSAVKSNISAATTMNGTAANLSSQLAAVGAGPHIPT